MKIIKFTSLLKSYPERDLVQQFVVTMGHWLIIILMCWTRNLLEIIHYKAICSTFI